MKKHLIVIGIVFVLMFVNLSGCEDIANDEKDTDGDGFNDSIDDFPKDVNEWLDSDSDGVGDNTDEFPSDSSETKDSDGDGYGDNKDYYPNDKSKWIKNNDPVIEDIEIMRPHKIPESRRSTYQFVAHYHDVDDSRETLEVKWDFGDGFGGYKLPIHTYRHFGYYDVVVTVTDPKGGSTTETERLWVGEIGDYIEEQGDMILTPMLSGDVEDIKFSSIFLLKMPDNWRIAGGIINNGDKLFNSIRLEFRFFDEDNIYLSSSSTSNKYLGMGEEWHFTDDIDGELDIRSFKIHITIN